MINEQRIYGLIGISRKAGKAASGSFCADKAIKSGEARLVILAEDASDNTKKSFENSCKYYDVDCICFGSRELLGKYTGSFARVVVTINDDGLKKSILSYMEQKENDVSPENR